MDAAGSTPVRLMAERTRVSPNDRMFGVNDPTCEDMPSFGVALCGATADRVGWGPHAAMIQVVSEVGFVDVDLEVWTAAPPPEPAEFVDDGELAVPGGQISLGQSLDSRFRLGVELPPGPGTYGVRVVGEGRERAEDIQYEEDLHPDPERSLRQALEGVERYRLQLWHTDDQPRWPDEDDEDDDE